MKFTGEHVLHAEPQKTWDTLLDPSVLVRTIPGCERLVSTRENSYDMTVTAGVAAVKGTYTGSCTLGDLQAPGSLVMDVNASGAPGTVGAKVNVALTDQGDGTTRLTYDADAIVGGMVGGVGQRMLTSVSRRLAGEFFGNLDQVLTGAAPAAAAEGVPAAAGEPAAVAAAPAAGQVFTAPVPARAAGDKQDFLLGVAVGAGLVLLGVVAGAVVGRRR